MTELDVEETDPLERLISKLAAEATHDAYHRAVAAGHTLVTAKAGLLVRINPDGTETRLSVLRAKHKVQAGSVFHIRSLVRTAQ